jgi:hypothetical protein
LSKDCFDNVFINQYIAYATPSSNVAKKHFFENNYNKFFENLGQHSNLKNKASAMAFINGDISLDKNFDGNQILLPRPFLKANHIELVE